jgi:hypothetical protein
MQRGRAPRLIRSGVFIDKAEENDLDCQHAKGRYLEP